VKLVGICEGFKELSVHLIVGNKGIDIIDMWVVVVAIAIVYMWVFVVSIWLIAQLYIIET